MSWLRHDEPSLADIQLDGGEVIGSEELASRNKQLEALLATEQEAHSQSKTALTELKLVERDCLHRLQLEAARASKAEDALLSKEEQTKGYKTAVANLQAALEDAQNKLHKVERERSRESDETNYMQLTQLEKLEKEVDELKKVHKKALEGEAFWKTKADRLELEQQQQQHSSKAISTSEGPASASTRQTSSCSICPDKDNNIRGLESQLAKLESTNATLSSTKASLDSRLLTLSNQHAALERSSESKLISLREALENTKEEMGYLRMEMADNESSARNKLEDKQREVTLLERMSGELQNEVKRERESCEILKEQVAELERCNEGLKVELENNASSTSSHIESLHSQIRDLEIAFQSSNSSLLSSRSALSHTESRLCELERLLDELHRQQNLNKGRNYEDEYVEGLRGEMEDERRTRMEMEGRAESVEERLAQVLEEVKVKEAEREEQDLQLREVEERLKKLMEQKEALSTEKQEEAGLELESARRALAVSQAALEVAEGSLASVTAQREETQLEISCLRAQLSKEENASAALASELEASESSLAAKDADLVEANEKAEEMEQKLSEKEDELLSMTTELESLKRDATALRDQLLALQSASPSSSSSPATPTLPSSKRKHTRATSAPFTPSPLRHASYPPTAMVSSPRSLAAEGLFTLTEHPDSEDPERAVILVARLREERDEAISQLSYYILEHGINAQAIQEELLTSRNEREQLAAEIVGLAAAAGAGQKAKEELVEMKQRLEEAERREEEGMDELEELCRELEAIKGRDEGVFTGHRKAEEQDSVPTPPASSTEESEDSADDASSPGIEELRVTIHSMEAEISELRTSLEERSTVIEELLSDKDSLSSSLQEKKLALLGAQNATLDLQSRLESLQTEYTAYKASSNVEKEELEGELDYVRLYLEGAQNLVIELEEAKKSAQMEKSILEKNLKNKIGRLSGDLQRDFESRKRIESDLYISRQDLAHLTKSAEEQEDTLRRTILSLVRAGKDFKAARTIAGSLQLEVESRDSDLETARLELQQAESEMAGLRAHVCEETSSDSAGREQVNLLIVLLVQASRQMTVLKEESIRSSSDLVYERQRREELELQFKLAEQRVQSLQEELALALASPASTEALEQDIRQLQSAKEEIEAQLEEAQARNSELAHQGHEYLETREELVSRTNEVQALHLELKRSQEGMEALKESLRLAEEEGKNLVMDFNMLSEEYEKRQMEDETRTMHSAQQDKRLAEAVMLQQELTQRSEEATSVVRDLEGRIKELEDELENKQVEVEETDDRYLASLKTIKKQSLALDKLKVRIEALQRANALLNSAVPKDTPDVLAPTPSSAKKRGLPREFVAPDPGPQAVIFGPGMQTVQMALRKASTETIRGGGQAQEEVAKSASSEALAEVRQTTTLSTVKMTVTSAPTKEEPAKRVVAPLKQSAVLSKPASSKPESVKTVADKVAPLAATAVTPNTALASSRPRRPLASVQPQASVPQQQSSTIPASSKLGSLSSKAAFKPAAPGAASLSSRPLAPKNSTTAAGQTDTKSLLAALQALKKPVGSVQTR